MPEANFDLVVIGGGINGAGIARDAAGRGLSVALVEARDLACATSSASSKLLHGGLRYLEHYEFRLVAEALAERETLLRIARHLAAPLRFVMPHAPGLRPRWMLRTGLFLYDHLARRSLLPGSEPVRLDAAPYRGALQPQFVHGFAYSDCRIDDARLVVANALDAAARGARVLVGSEVVSATRNDGTWKIRLSSGEELAAAALVNATGPWVKRVLEERLGQPVGEDLRLVQGSHVVVPRLYDGDYAFLLQNEDRRVVFLIPFDGDYTLIGTTEVAVDGDPAMAQASQEEVAYLCRAASRYLAHPVRPGDVRWRYAGVRPLLDDRSRELSAVTRDYTLKVTDAHGTAPLVSVFGGKITTYRRLAEQAMDALRAYFPNAPAAWTANAPLPGSDYGDAEELRRELRERYRRLPEAVVAGVLARHGSRAALVLGDGEVGEHFGSGLTARELRYFVEQEWARTAEDILWRRSKVGLRLTPGQTARVAEVVGR